MVVKVDTRVSAELHPGVIESIEGFNEETAEYVRPAVQAFEAAYEQTGKVHSAREAAKRNPTWNESQQILETQGFADRAEKAVLSKFDSAHNQLSKSVNAIERQLTEPLESRAANSIAAEIRAHVKALKSDGERVTFIRQAITQGDRITAGSVLGAPSYLSGIGADMQVQLTRQWHEAESPAAARRLTVMKSALGLLEKRAMLFVSELQTAVGKTHQEVTQLREAKKLAEASFSMPGA